MIRIARNVSQTPNVPPDRRPKVGLTHIPCKFDISALCPAHSTGVQQGVNVDGLESMGQ